MLVRNESLVKFRILSCIDKILDSCFLDPLLLLIFSLLGLFLSLSWFFFLLDFFVLHIGIVSNFECFLNILLDTSLLRLMHLLVRWLRLHKFLLTFEHDLALNLCLILSQ